MSDKFQGKYRIASARLQNWDYRWNAAYFITICTQNREHYFGNIIDDKMQLSEIGHIVEIEWLKTFEIRPDMNLQMDEYVIMPNHFHAIIIIGENKYNIKRSERECTEHRDDDCGDKCDDDHGDDRRDAMHCVSTVDTTTDTVDTDTNPSKNKFGPQSKNLASIIRGFKIGVTINVRKICADFAWQPRFYDHIIRNDRSFQKIKNYICQNPAKWTDDKFYHSC